MKDLDTTSFMVHDMGSIEDGTVIQNIHGLLLVMWLGWEDETFTGLFS